VHISLPRRLVPAVYHGRAHLKPAQYLQYGQQTVSGYTMVNYIYADGMVEDGGQYHGVTQVFGATDQGWPCNWTQIGQYNWAWEPPGCVHPGPPTHSFYVAAQINGSGAYGWWQDYAATTYVNMSYGNQGPVTSNSGADGINFGVDIICPIAGKFLNGILAAFGYIASNIRPAKEFLNFTGAQSGNPLSGFTCGMTPACNNPQTPPAAWAINLSYVLQYNAASCAVAYTCYGACVRSWWGGPWTCPDNNPGYTICPRRSVPFPQPYSSCTVHP